MPFGPDPSSPAFLLERGRLALDRATAADAHEVFEILWHRDMTNLPDEKKPTSVKALAEEFEALRVDSMNRGVRQFDWVARRKDSGAAVALAIGELDARLSEKLLYKPDGSPGDIVIVETRFVEATAYVHPDHQEQGDYWGSRASDLVFAFGRDQFGCTRRRARILITNKKAQRRAARGGLELESSGDPPGYQIWEGPILDADRVPMDA